MNNVLLDFLDTTLVLFISSFWPKNLVLFISLVSYNKWDCNNFTYINYTHEDRERERETVEKYSINEGKVKDLPHNHWVN